MARDERVLGGVGTRLLPLLHPSGDGSLLTLILAGGEGTRLAPLTRRCAKSMLPFAGRRLIDYTLLNCQRSGLRDVVVLTQSRADEVQGYLEHSWCTRLDGLGCLSSRDAGRLYRGTADAVRAALEWAPPVDYVLVLASDHVYRMDYRRMVETLERTGADVVVSAYACGRSESRRLGVLQVDDDGRVAAFDEKPVEPTVITGRRELCLASMGIYLFRRPVLERYLAAHPDAVDFGYHVLPAMVRTGARITAYEFGSREPIPWWRDIGDLDSFHGALMDLVAGPPEFASEFLFELGYEPPLRAHHHHDPDDSPGIGNESWIGPGAIVNGLAITRSVLGAHVRVDHHAEIRESVILDRAVVGACARLRRVVVEEGAVVPAGAVIGFDHEVDARQYAVSPGGLVLVPARRQAPLEATTAELV